MKFNDAFFDEVYKLSQMGKADVAIEMLDSVPKNHSEYPRALFYKSMILKNENDDSEPLELFKKAIQTEFLNQVSCENIEDVFDMAMECFYDGDFEMAIELFDSCIDNDYNIVDSLKFKSACLASLELNEDANECIDEALKIDADNIELLQSKSCYLEHLGDYDESLNWINKAIELDPDCVENFHIKAITLFKMKNYDEAFESIDTYPEDIDGILLKVKFYNQLEDYENVEKCFETAENIDGNNLEVLFAKTMYYMMQNDFENANEYIDKCLKIEPQSDIFTKFKLAIVREFEDSDLLNDTLNDIYQTNPDFIDAMLNDDSPAMSRVSDDESSKYALEEFIRYGKDYPSQSMNYNIYKVLSALKSDSDISNVYSNIELKDSYSEEMITDVLLENDFIRASNLDEMNVKKEAQARSPQELSALLRQEGIVASGKKKKLVKLAVKNVPPIKFCRDFIITDEGEEFLNEYSWFAYEECLLPFNLSDVGKYIDDHDENDYEEVLEDYICEHIDLAHQKENFDYLDDCLISQSLFYMHQEDYCKCLRTSLSELILKFNPIYEYEISYALYIIINSLIIENIRKCLEALDVDIESLFYEIWDLKDGEIEYASKEECFNYLKRALDGEALEELSEEYEENYINVICRD